MNKTVKLDLCPCCEHRGWVIDESHANECVKCPKCGVTASSAKRWNARIFEWIRNKKPPKVDGKKYLVLSTEGVGVAIFYNYPEFSFFRSTLSGEEEGGDYKVFAWMPIPPVSNLFFN